MTTIKPTSVLTAFILSSLMFVFFAFFVMGSIVFEWLSVISLVLSIIPLITKAILYGLRKIAHNIISPHTAPRSPSP